MYKECHQGQRLQAAVVSRVRSIGVIATSDSVQSNFTASNILFSIFATVTLSPVNTTNCSDVVITT